MKVSVSFFISDDPAFSPELSPGGLFSELSPLPGLLGSEGDGGGSGGGGAGSGAENPAALGRGNGSGGSGGSGSGTEHPAALGRGGGSGGSGGAGSGSGTEQ